MKTFTSIALAGIALVIMAIAQSSGSSVTTDPMPAVTAFLDKEASFFDKMGEFYYDSVSRFYEATEKTKLYMIGHLLDSIKIDRKHIILDSVTGWQEVPKEELSRRVSKAIDKAYTVADSKLSTLIKYSEDFEHANKRTHGDFKRELYQLLGDINRIVLYLKERDGAASLLSN